MSRITTWAAGMILIIVTAFATTFAPVYVAAQTTPITNVNPGMGAPGTRFAFMATGFASGETIAVWVNTPTGAPMAIKAEQLNGANRDGRADWVLDQLPQRGRRYLADGRPWCQERHPARDQLRDCRRSSGPADC